jgi:hypothetical protein
MTRLHSREWLLVLSLCVSVTSTFHQQCEKLGDPRRLEMVCCQGRTPMDPQTWLWLIWTSIRSEGTTQPGLVFLACGEELGWHWSMMHILWPLSSEPYVSPSCGEDRDTVPSQHSLCPVTFTWPHVPSTGPACCEQETPLPKSRASSS